MARLRMSLDTFGYYWNLAVINYDLDKQIRLIRKTNEGFRHIDFRRNRGRAVGIAAAVLLVLFLLLYLKEKHFPSREERILGSFLSHVRRRYGISRDGQAEGLQELAARVGAPAVQEFVRIYCGAVYRDRRLSGEEYRRLKGIIRGMRK